MPATSIKYCNAAPFWTGRTRTLAAKTDYHRPTVFQVTDESVNSPDLTHNCNDGRTVIKGTEPATCVGGRYHIHSADDEQFSVAAARGHHHGYERQGDRELVGNRPNRKVTVHLADCFTSILDSSVTVTVSVGARRRNGSWRNSRRSWLKTQLGYALTKNDINRNTGIRQPVQVALQLAANHALVIGQLRCASVVSVTLQSQQQV